MAVIDHRVLVESMELQIEKHRTGLESDLDPVQTARHRGCIAGLRHVMLMIKDMVGDGDEA